MSVKAQLVEQVQTLHPEWSASKVKKMSIATLETVVAGQGFTEEQAKAAIKEVMTEQRSGDTTEREAEDKAQVQKAKQSLTAVPCTTKGFREVPLALITTPDGRQM